MMFISVQVAIMICPFIIELDFDWWYAGLLAACIASPLETVLSGIISGAKDAVAVCKGFVYIVILFGIQGACLGITWHFSDEYGETMNTDWMLAGSVAAGALLLLIHPMMLAIKYGIYSCQGKPDYD